MFDLNDVLMRMTYFLDPYEELWIHIIHGWLKSPAVPPTNMTTLPCQNLPLFMGAWRTSWGDGKVPMKERSKRVQLPP
jgi:hypothetical protein